MLNALRENVLRVGVHLDSLVMGNTYRIWQSRKFGLTIINRVHALMAMRVTRVSNKRLGTGIIRTKWYVCVCVCDKSFPFFRAVLCTGIFSTEHQKQTKTERFTNLE
jgi:hypothetical protein